jgi:hypothetical protein
LQDQDQNPTTEETPDEEESGTQPSDDQTKIQRGRDIFDRIRRVRQTFKRGGDVARGGAKSAARGAEVGQRGARVGRAAQTGIKGAQAIGRGAAAAGRAAMVAGRLAVQAVGALVGAGPAGWAVLLGIVLIIVVVIGVLLAVVFFLGKTEPFYPDPNNPTHQEDKLKLLENIQDPDAKRLRIIEETKQIKGLLEKAKTSAKTAEAQEKITKAIQKADELLKAAEDLVDPAKKGVKPEDVQNLARQFVELYIATLPIIFPGNRLPVEWFTQPVGSKTCNYWAAYMAARYVAKVNGLDLNKVKSPTEINQCFLNGTKGYFTTVLRQAGLTNFEVVRGSGFPAGSTRDINSPWGKIYNEVVNSKNPVVVATGFSKTQVRGGCSGREGKPSHFLVVVGFSEDGQMVYVNDSGSRFAQNNNDPLAKNANRHIITDYRWVGRYCEYYYVKKS